MAALVFGHHEIVELLLEQPTVDLNVLDYYGRSVAHVAVEYSGKKCVKVLSRDSRVNWNAKDRNGDRSEERGYGDLEDPPQNPWR